MKTILTAFINKPALHFSMVLITLSLLSFSCNEEEVPEDPYFYIENEPSGLSVDMNEHEQIYTIRSNRPWKLVPQDTITWARAFPDEGDDDGIFRFLIEKNTKFNARTVNFAILVDGEELPTLFRIDQEARIPYITVNEGDTINVPAAGGNVTVSFDANVEWTYSLDTEEWLEEIDVNKSEIKFLAYRNTGVARTAVLTVTSNDFPDVKQVISIIQSPGNIVFEDNFNWLHYGSTVPYEWQDAVRYDAWTPEEKAHWEVTPNSFHGNAPCVYGMMGYIKLGKTKYGGDIISPPLDILGTVNLKVTFKSAVYISATGNIDDNILKVYALGAGTCSVDQFTIDNIPNSKAEDEAGVENNIWADDRAFEFTITGATNETRIKFLGGDYNLKGVGKGKNRIFLDDIKVEIIQ